MLRAPITRLVVSFRRPFQPPGFRHAILCFRVNKLVNSPVARSTSYNISTTRPAIKNVLHSKGLTPCYSPNRHRNHQSNKRHFGIDHAAQYSEYRHPPNPVHAHLIRFRRYRRAMLSPELAPPSWTLRRSPMEMQSLWRVPESRGVLASLEISYRKQGVNLISRRNGISNTHSGRAKQPKIG
jgi:hypothetical protein